MTGCAATGSAKTAELGTGGTRGTQRDGTPRSEISTARRRAIDPAGLLVTLPDPATLTLS